MSLNHINSTLMVLESVVKVAGCKHLRVLDLLRQLLDWLDHSLLESVLKEGCEADEDEDVGDEKED